MEYSKQQPVAPPAGTDYNTQFTAPAQGAPPPYAPPGAPVYNTAQPVTPHGVSAGIITSIA